MLPSAYSAGTEQFPDDDTYVSKHAGTAQ
jgi:hypothetical protein